MTTSYFVGKHVPEVREILATAAVSGTNVLFLGQPGCGKTDMSISGMDLMVGIDKGLIVEFSPSTNPSVIDGFLDMNLAIANPPMWKIVKTGTPQDVNCAMWVADEIMRANEAVHDSLLKVLEPKRVALKDRKIAVGTSNFLAKGERSEALLERFGSVYWFPANGVSAEEIVEAQMDSLDGTLSLPGKMPTLAEIEAIRAAVTGKNAKAAVKQAVRELSDAATRGLVIDTVNGQTTRSFGVPSPRRMTIWTRILTRRTILDTGVTDFKEVSKMALSMLAYAWVSRTPAEAADWKTLVLSLADPVGAAIEDLMVKCFEAMNNAARSAVENGNPLEAAGVLGTILQDGLRNLQSAIPDYKTDQRYKDAEDLVSTQLSEFVRGGRTKFGKDATDGNNPDSPF